MVREIRTDGLRKKQYNQFCIFIILIRSESIDSFHMFVGWFAGWLAVTIIALKVSPKEFMGMIGHINISKISAVSRCNRLADLTH